jgi:hypothetical protein
MPKNILDHTMTRSGTLPTRYEIDPIDVHTGLLIRPIATEGVERELLMKSPRVLESGRPSTARHFT